MSFYYFLRKKFRSYAPIYLRSALFSGNSRLSRAVISVKTILEKNATHNEIYDRDYYLKYSSEVAISGKAIALSLQHRFNPSDCIDVGCGSGEIMHAISTLGIESFGYDNSDAALELCREKGLAVEKLDLESHPSVTRTADCVISTEVAEHIPEGLADAYVDFLTQSGRVILLTAATPGQGGTDHVNEQPNEYWIEKFRTRNFNFDIQETEEVRSEWLAAGVDNHRAGNLLIFHRSET